MSTPSNDWSMRPISDLFKRVRRPVGVEPDTTCREIGIRSHCKMVEWSSYVDNGEFPTGDWGCDRSVVTRSAGGATCGSGSSMIGGRCGGLIRHAGDTA